ncbi:MAG: PAS domain S-box protein [Bacteroidetes bacterium]|nr:PAS domain S-box protein [Bacteroidota bacterium]
MSFEPMISSMDRTFEKSGAEVSFKEILEYAPVGILIFQRDGKIKFANNNLFAFKNVLGGNPSEVIGRSIFEYRLFESVDIRNDLDTIKNGGAFEREITTSRTLSGGKVTLFLKGSPIIIDDEFSGGVLILEDIKQKAEVSELSLGQSAKFRDFLGSISDFYLMADTDGGVKFHSQKNADMFDFIFDAETLKTTPQTKKLSSFLFKNLLENVVSSNQALSTQFPFEKDSRNYIASVTLVPFSEDGFSVDFVTVLLKMLTKETEEPTLSAEEIDELSKYQQITANVVDGLIGLNKSGKIVFWNESSAKIFGLARSEVYGKFIGKILPAIDEKYFEEIQNSLKENKTWQSEIKVGEDESIAEYFFLKGGVIGEEADETIMLLCSNVTERIRKENELKKSEERFRNIVTNSHDFICTLDLRGLITYANPRFLEVFQYGEDELRNVRFAELIDSYFLMQNSFTLSDVATKNLQSAELPLITKMGQKIHVLASFATVKDITGTVQYYNVILTDITLKKESEKDLLLIRSVFEASQDGIALISKNRFVLVNDSFVKMFGYRSASEILGENPVKFADKKDKEKLSRYMELADEKNESPSRYSFTGVRRDKSIVEIENSVSSYQIENENFLVWVFRDVTEEKKAQNELLASEERYRSITENINECIWTAENKGGQLQAVFYTPAIRRITSYDAQQFLDDPELWGKIIHPDDADFVGDKLDKLYKNRSRNSETLEYRIIDSSGNVIWIENKISIIRDAKGRIQKIFGIISDITIPKRAEEELKKSAQELKESNETKDRFISIVSHDLRTPFSSILGFTDLLLTDDELDEEKKKQYVEFIQESSKSMLSLVNSLLDWTRLQTGRIKFEPERINVKYVISKAIQILSGTALQKHINLVSDLTKDFYVHADENLLLQVFNNLISNAIKFTKPNGNIKIDATADIEKRQVRFSVKDDGIGIKKEDIAKLFKIDSKFTTAGTEGEKGSGLGLSLVHEIINKHGGNIWVESEYGHGAEFIFTIPVSSTYILLVDDAKMDRVLYSKLLKNLMPNYSVLEAENGRHALDVIKQYSPALIITDHHMPLMSGYDLVKQLNVTELKYKPPVIILSGDITKSIEEEYKSIGVEYIFQKPVNLGNFKNAIENSLRKAIYT